MFSLSLSLSLSLPLLKYPSICWQLLALPPINSGSHSVRTKTQLQDERLFVAAVLSHSRPPLSLSPISLPPGLPSIPPPSLYRPPLSRCTVSHYLLFAPLFVRTSFMCTSLRSLQVLNQKSVIFAISERCAESRRRRRCCWHTAHLNEEHCRGDAFIFF